MRRSTLAAHLTSEPNQITQSRDGYLRGLTERARAGKFFHLANDSWRYSICRPQSAEKRLKTSGRAERKKPG